MCLPPCARPRKTPRPEGLCQSKTLPASAVSGRARRVGRAACTSTLNGSSGTLRRMDPWGQSVLARHARRPGCNAACQHRMTYWEWRIVGPTVRGTSFLLAGGMPRRAGGLRLPEPSPPPHRVKGAGTSGQLRAPRHRAERPPSQARNVPAPPERCRTASNNARRGSRPHLVVPVAGGASCSTRPACAAPKTPGTQLIPDDYRKSKKRPIKNFLRPLGQSGLLVPAPACRFQQREDMPRLMFGGLTGEVFDPSGG